MADREISREIPEIFLNGLPSLTTLAGRYGLMPLYATSGYKELV